MTKKISRKGTGKSRALVAANGWGAREAATPSGKGTSHEHFPNQLSTGIWENPVLPDD